MTKNNFKKYEGAIAILAVSFAVGIVFLFAPSCDLERVEVEDEGAAENEAIPEGLIQPEDLEYKGAFRLPAGEEDSGESWAWGGTAMTYYPEGDPENEDDYPGSIFGTGHDQYQHVSEIGIPEPVVSSNKNLEDLNIAETLQDFVDIRQGLFGELELPRVGMEYLKDDDKIHFAWGQHLQDQETGLTHGRFDIDLSEPNREGPWEIEGMEKYLTTDYIFEIPKNWSDESVPGMRLATGRYRDGGQGAQGPSIIAYGVSEDAEESEVLSNKPLLLYPSFYDDPDGENAIKNYHHSDEWSGGAWIEKGDKAAVVIPGIKGKGEYWYGYYDGSVWPEEPPFPDEGPGERGWWSDEFEAQMLFYDPADLAKVAKGEMEPYEPQPYTVLDFDDVLYNRPKNEIRQLGSVSYDRERGLLYVFELRGDVENENPLVHVWKIK